MGGNQDSARDTAIDQLLSTSYQGLCHLKEGLHGFKSKKGVTRIDHKMVNISTNLRLKKRARSSKDLRSKTATCIQCFDIKGSKINRNTLPSDDQAKKRPANADRSQI